MVVGAALVVLLVVVQTESVRIFVVLELVDLVVVEEVTGVVVEPDPDPEPIAVVIGPDSMYTPLTHQSSIPA